MSIALGGLHLAVTQKLADHLQGRAATDQEGSKGVSEIVDPNIRDPHLPLYV